MLSEGVLFSIEPQIEINLFSWEMQIEKSDNISKVNLSKDSLLRCSLWKE